ncbi:ABC transporter, CydDC cysteine exporter (CydDC-E) family, permease/ATP-binding protein CydD [Microbacterium sp. C448]|uniref:thiol reductant ABC exporter subunit CydD n=1 Tax=Microbacterium sp. C448 TaxID=1177594 RepID=UPI0003DE3B10|nr:thiol reductant ABC exporter subunit CydD [Microbacterium sp. C448]CDK01959.1 ABC transporter, CydDC cysteine exporter (CydDC-E) family, permease/ATP-binding protein CydD [Microbacterium sp. C448]
MDTGIIGNPGIFDSAVTQDQDVSDAPSARTPPVDPRLLKYATASRAFFAIIAAIALLQTAVIVAFAWLLTRAIVGVIEGMPASDLAATLGALAGVVALRALLAWVRELSAAGAAARVQSQLRAGLLDAIGALGPGWLDGRNSAKLALTAGHGLDALEAYFGRYLPQLVQTAIATPVIILVMWWQDWISGLTVLLTIPLIPIFMILIGLATRAVQKRQWATLQQLAARFADTVEGLGTLKVFGRQHRAAASIASVTETYRVETMRVLRVSFLSGFALEFLASISVAIIAVSIGFRLVDGALPLSIGLFVLLLAPEAYLPLRQVGVQFHAAAEGVAATDDVFAVLDSAKVPVLPARVPVLPARVPVPGTLDAETGTLGRETGTLALQGVRVRRGDRMLPAVTFTAAPGQIALIEGPSGAGKTSLVAALRGAAEWEGSATLGDTDLRDISPSTWLAWAGQQPGLIAGTVTDNVTLGDPTPDPARVDRALALAQADGIDASLPLDVRGAGLSGGQAQRVAVARALYRHLAGRAPVIALDEPSSALDAATEAALWRSLRGIADAGATILLVSHRRSAREIADVIVALQPAGVTR